MYHRIITNFHRTYIVTRSLYESRKPCIDIPTRYIWFQRAAFSTTKRRNRIIYRPSYLLVTYCIVPIAIARLFSFLLTFCYRKRMYRSKPRLPRSINTVTTPTCWTSGHSTNKRIDFTVDRVYRCFVPIFIECVGE